MRQLVSRFDVAAWIAEEDGRMTGFAVVEWARRKSGVTAYIQTIEVVPEARGRGVGRQLLGRIEAANVGAIRLYETQGYSCLGRQENYYPLGRAALIYKKRLDAGRADPMGVLPALPGRQ